MAASSEELILALRRALTLDPSAALRLHLASILVETDAAEALALVTDVLADQPDSVEALVLACLASTRMGHHERAASYRRLAIALEAPDHDMRAEEHRQTPEPTSPRDLGDLAEVWEESAAPAEPDIGDYSRPAIRLNDVAGMVDVKRHLDLAFFAPLRNPALAIAYRKRLSGGLLLWGPPGCGKTHLARAVAGEMGASFYNIGIADVLDMWIGSSERNLRDIFRYAREHAPCVLFLDELDALGQKRSGLRQGGAALRSTVNQLLAELDGFASDNDGVYVLAATNHPWDLDEALIRPGRFDRSLLVLPPDGPAREQIIALRLSGRPVGRVKWKPIVAATDGWSGADVTLLCESATERAMSESLATGTMVLIGESHFKAALREIRPSLDSWFQVARNYASYSNKDGRFDGLVEYLGNRQS